MSQLVNEIRNTSKELTLYIQHNDASQWCHHLIPDDFVDGYTSKSCAVFPSRGRESEFTLSNKGSIWLKLWKATYFCVLMLLQISYFVVIMEIIIKSIPQLNYNITESILYFSCWTCKMFNRCLKRLPYNKNKSQIVHSGYNNIRGTHLLSFQENFFTIQWSKCNIFDVTRKLLKVSTSISVIFCYVFSYHVSKTFVDRSEYFPPWISSRIHPIALNPLLLA